MYQRVIPRDLFNESKLLKCLGQLALIVHEVRDCPKGLKMENSGRDFRIDQRKGCGGLYVETGLKFTVGRWILELYTNYNSKDAFPLICESVEDGEVYVFNDDGTLTDAFRKEVEFLLTYKTPT